MKVPGRRYLPRCVGTGCTFAIFTLFFLGGLGECTSQDEARVAKLNSVYQAKKDKVLSLTVDSFRKYIEVSPRSYSLIVLFTADASICQPCAAMRRNFGQVVMEYYSLPSKHQASHPVFFAELKLNVKQQKFLVDYSVNHVPILYYFGRGTRKQFPKALRSGPESLNIEEMGSGMNAMKSFINSRIKSRLRVMRTDYKIPFVPTMRAVLPFLAIWALSIVVLAAYYGWIWEPMFWFVCCVIVYMYSVGGGHFSWIHDVPFVVVNSEGATDFIANGSRSQYAAEGLVVAVLCSLISAFIIFVNELPNYVDNKGAQTGTGLLLALTTSSLVTALLSLHNIKMPGYMQYNE